jgi:methyl-accepting chemotaxis protein
VHRATIEQTKGSAEVINATESMSNLVRNGVRNTQQIVEAANQLTQKSETLVEVLDMLI